MIEIIEDGHGDEHMQEAEQLLEDIQRLCERQWLQKVRREFPHFLFLCCLAADCCLLSSFSLPN